MALVALASCAPGPAETTTPSPSAPQDSSPTQSPAPDSPAPTAEPTPAPPSSEPTVTPSPEPTDDPRWKFYTDDPTEYRSAWYDGAHRMMIPFGCSPAPYYDPDPRCPGEQGFHHGVDMAIACGVPLRSAVNGEIVTEGLGPAYGEQAFRIRTADADFIIGHAQNVQVSAGDRVTKGQVLGEIGDLGAPDGCHLHFEKRPVGGSVDSAVDPLADLGLH